MKLSYLAATSIALLAVSSGAPAQFVKGNEAVKVLPDGSKRVETPPLPSITLAQPCPASRQGCAGGGWRMVETSKGLMECTELYARPSTCRPSSYGSEKLPRVWVVNVHGHWKQCQYPDVASTCVSTKDLPLRAVQ
jgi:hypothetical protein